MTLPVSCVIVTWQSERFIADCLDSLERQTVPPMQTLLVDNGSTDRTLEIARARRPEVEIIELGANTGFCRANNIGYKQSYGDLVLFANPDTRLEPTYLQEAGAAFGVDSMVGMVSGKLLRFDRRTIDSAGQILTAARMVRDRGFGQADRGQYAAPAEIDAVCGAMAFYRRKMIEEILLENDALFDEDHFAFWEDMDVGWRARRLGWKAVYVPSAVAYHFRGGSQIFRGPMTRLTRMAGRPAGLKYHIVKNRWLTMIKNERPADYLLRLPLIWAMDLALLLYLLLSAPGAFARLFLECGCYVRAWRTRCFLGSKSRRKNMNAGR
ncbi:glycosyltransferase family 2 protein [bacterium]|nr:glycosyltransferase family 2 protein [bacterium]